MFRPGKTLTWFIIGFLFTFVTSLILLTQYVKIDLNGDLVTTYALMSLLVAIIFAGSARGKTHFGHFPFLLGMVIAGWAGLALYGNFELPTLKKGLWWVIEDPAIKRNLAVIWFVGMIFFVIGLRWIGANLFFMRFFNKGR